MACTLPSRLAGSTVLRLRGLCARSGLDTVYGAVHGAGGVVTYQGVARTTLTWVQGEQRWRAEVAGRNISATSRANLHRWPGDAS